MWAVLTPDGGKDCSKHNLHNECKRKAHSLASSCMNWCKSVLTFLPTGCCLMLSTDSSLWMNFYHYLCLSLSPLSSLLLLAWQFIVSVGGAQTINAFIFPVYFWMFILYSSPSRPAIKLLFLSIIIASLQSLNLQTFLPLMARKLSRKAIECIKKTNKQKITQPSFVLSCLALIHFLNFLKQGINKVLATCLSSCLLLVLSPLSMLLHLCPLLFTSPAPVTESLMSLLFSCLYTTFSEMNKQRIWIMKYLDVVALFSPVCRWYYDVCSCIAAAFVF